MESRCEVFLPSRGGIIRAHEIEQGGFSPGSAADHGDGVILGPCDGDPVAPSHLRVAVGWDDEGHDTAIDSKACVGAVPPEMAVDGTLDSIRALRPGACEGMAEQKEQYGPE
jgi:hypothetical protein